MMQRKVDRISVAGFRSIRSLKDFELRALNVLVGANGSGKTNFVSLFAFLHELVEQNMQLTVERAGGADTLFLGPDVTKEIEVSLTFGPNAYRFTLEPTRKNRLVFGKEDVSYRGRWQLLGSGQTESKLKDLKDRAGAIGTHGIPYYVYDAVTGWIVYHFHNTSETSGVRREGTIRDYVKLRNDASNLAAFLLRLRKSSPNVYGLIRDAVRLVAPFFDDFKLRPEPRGQDTVVQLEWTQRGSDYPFHPSQLSDGTLRFICLTSALLQPAPPATMLFDEPELGLHPFSLSVLADLIKQASRRSQIIISTQSASLLDHFETEDIIVVDREDGASTFRRLGPDELKQWLEDYSLGELWQKNVFRGGPVRE